MKVRKRPIEVEAIQFTGDNGIEVHRFAQPGHAVRVKEKSIEIHTLEGVMTAPIGWWIIKGVAGEFYACEPKIFEKTYEKIEEHVYDDSDAFADWEKG